MNDELIYGISIVIPVYQGENSLPVLMAEILPLTQLQKTRNGDSFRVSEVLLVHDCGPGHADKVIEDLLLEYSFVRAIWLTNNYGQHAATLAGMASSVGEWVVTMDEDGQQDPSNINKLLEMALTESLQVVYAQPINKPPHGWIRNGLSCVAKKLADLMIGNDICFRFNSFRLVDGEIARILAAYCGYGVYLDVALSWLSSRIGSCPVMLRSEFDERSGYTMYKLFSHFWRLMLSSGTGLLRIISAAGFISFLISLCVAVYAIYGKFSGSYVPQGWASILVTMSFFSGLILMAMGVISEYIALNVGISMGRPLYAISSRPIRNRHTG